MCLDLTPNLRPHNRHRQGAIARGLQNCRGTLAVGLATRFSRSTAVGFVSLFNNHRCCDDYLTPRSRPPVPGPWSGRQWPNGDRPDFFRFILIARKPWSNVNFPPFHDVRSLPSLRSFLTVIRPRCPRPSFQDWLHLPSILAVGRLVSPHLNTRLRCRRVAAWIGTDQCLKMVSQSPAPPAMLLANSVRGQEPLDLCPLHPPLFRRKSGRVALETLPPSNVVPTIKIHAAVVTLVFGCITARTATGNRRLADRARGSTTDVTLWLRATAAARHL
mmetsp:Transcript_57113/g.122658  ORF Transcript_57113/g.122658 Transcript_57113/m.122658 type:complete len:274 (-) Transcript_57113:48-869(-)